MARLLHCPELTSPLSGSPSRYPQSKPSEAGSMGRWQKSLIFVGEVVNEKSNISML